MEDVSQEVFVRLYFSHWNDYAGGFSNPRFARLTVNACYDYCEKARRKIGNLPLCRIYRNGGS